MQRSLLTSILYFFLLCATKLYKNWVKYRKYLAILLACDKRERDKCFVFFVFSIFHLFILLPLHMTGEETLKYGGVCLSPCEKV